MAIALDTSVNGGNLNGGGDLTWTHACTGTNLILFVLTNHVSAVPTYNSVSMTLAKTVTDSNYGTLNLYYLLNPATGSHTVSITTGGANTDGLSASYTGVSQIGFPDSSNSSANNVGTSLTLATTTVADNSWIIAGTISASSGTLSAGTNQTARQNSNVFKFQLGDTNAAQTPAGSKSMQTNNSQSASMSMLVVSFAPPAAVIATQPSGYALFL